MTVHPILLPPEHETQVICKEECVGDLATALGMWMGSGDVSEMQAGAFVYATLKLAHGAGVEKAKALQPFDVLHDFAHSIWKEIESEQ